MHDLAFLDTGYLAILLLLSLVLPLLMSWQGPRAVSRRNLGMKTVWTGQMLTAMAAAVVLSSALAAPYAVAFGVVSCACCNLVLLRQLRS
jgi:O-antigen/teichoic acid export membrane protein